VCLPLRLLLPPLPAGRHFKFDEAGNAMETPVSRQRRAPRHTKFDDDGNPIPAQPRWR
jgi:hypothetical protein